MKNLSSSELEKYQIMETPVAIFGKVMWENSPIYASEIQKSKNLQKQTKDQILYLPDAIYFDPDDLSKWEREALIESINKVRKAIASSYEISYPNMLNLQTTEQHIKADFIPKLSWTPVSERQDVIYKISRVKTKHKFSYPDLIHPNISPEAIRKISADQILTIAPKHPEISNLSDNYFSFFPSEKFSAIVQAMTGNNHLHQIGFVHGDIKTNNIYIFPNSNRVVEAKLGDCEGIVPIEAKTLPNFVSNDYYEYSYYPVDEPVFDIQSDLFSWGIILAETCSEINFSDEFPQILRQNPKIHKFSDLHKLMMREIINKWGNSYPKQIQSLIEKLIAPRPNKQIFATNPNFRGNLQAIMAELNLLQIQMKDKESQKLSDQTTFRGILNLTKPSSSA